VPEHPRPKAYRVYRGGHVRKDDPDAARFSFGSAGAGVKEPRPVTPAGLSRPGAPGRQQPPAAPALPGRQVATVPSRRRFWPGWKKGIPLVLGVIALLFCFWLYLGYRSFSNEVAQANKRLDKRTKAALAPAGNVLTSPQVTLVLGSDSRGAHTTARADSIILFRTDPGKHLISMLSIPRDLRVPIAGHGDTKINAAFAYGGAPLLIRTINTLTGFHVNHIVLVNFTGFKELIDSLGGVTIYNKRAIASSQPFDGIMWHFQKGTITLDGRRALAYSRIRHTTNPRDTDISRTERQQLVMQALSHQLVSFSSLLHLPSIGRDIARPLTTDLSANELLGLGWEKFRASRTLQCHLGGSPLVIGGQDEIAGVTQNRLVVQMFLGQIAPQPPPKSSIYDPGCTIK
jgi:polyisoprenyl-teichoic acid--peptidoglycan teichoic acid transferase